MVRIARERVSNLFGLAEREARGAHPELADRYVALARRIGMRYNVRLRQEYRELYCRACSAFWVEGRTVRTRLRRGPAGPDLPAMWVPAPDPAPAAGSSHPAACPLGTPESAAGRRSALDPDCGRRRPRGRGDGRRIRPVSSSRRQRRGGRAAKGGRLKICSRRSSQVRILAPALNLPSSLSRPVGLGATAVAHT